MSAAADRLRIVADTLQAMRQMADQFADRLELLALEVAKTRDEIQREEAVAYEEHERAPFTPLDEPIPYAPTGKVPT